MRNWGTYDREDITHEFGHMIGNKDEYFTVDGRRYGSGRAHKGIMNDPSDHPKKIHFEKIRQNIAKMLNVTDNNCVII